MKIKGNMDKFYYSAFPMQAVLVTCNDRTGKTNAITIAWHTPISREPPLYGISVSPKRYSYELIKESKEFVINFAPYKLVEKIHFCGTHSGKKVDKIKEAGLSLEKIEGFETPIIKECYAHMICHLNKDIELGDHTIFVGEVKALYLDKDAFKEGILNNKNVQPCYYLGENTYTTIEKSSKKF